MQIRLVKENEMEKLLYLYHHLHETDSPLPPEDKVKQIWEKIIQNECLSVFGLFVDNNLISSCYLNVIPNLTRSCSPYGIIENVVTHLSFRNKGYGKAIIKHTLNCAWDNGCYKVMLYTSRTGDAVLKFYETIGFNKQDKQAFVIKRAE